MPPIAIALACVSLLTACHDGGQQGAAAAHPTPARASASRPAPACAREPELGYSEYEWADSTGVFAGDTPAFAALQSNFHQAYAQACDAGWLAQAPLVDPASAHPGMLMLANAPDANIASIYLDTRADVPAAAHDTLLEYPFVDAGKRARVPGVDELREAIYCRSVGATEAEAESSGRCLPD